MSAQRTGREALGTTEMLELVALVAAHAMSGNVVTAAEHRRSVVADHDAPELSDDGSATTPVITASSRSRPVLEGEVGRLSARVEELERELEESRAQAAKLERFASMAAHEVLKPLVMSEAFATMIAERGGHRLDLDTRRDVDTLIRISSRMRVLVEAMLMDARPDQEPMRRQAVDISKILNDCVEMLGAEIRARDVIVDVDPMPVVPGDEALLTGVFGNLLSNALQYGPREGAEIQISAERSEAGWTFSVESPGPPIPARDRQRIFEPWQRGWGERRSKGVGLGLAIVRQVVERHGGQVGVTSPPNAAANRFYFTLPA